MSTLRRRNANAIRALAMDAVQRANSGHPGMPMGMADIAEVLWRDELCHNPANPKWSNRDRFILSNGHGSMLHYALLHLSGYDVSLQDLKDFRQLNSKTPGHPEYGHTPGVETTTGPLGQGLANAVGMAIAESRLAAEFNREGFSLVDHHTYVFVGDGCLMEGISHEACSLAGTLELGKLIVIYDDNGISIDGAVAGWFGEDVVQRFRAYQWHVVPEVDGHDADAIAAALAAAKDETQRPSIICCRTQIGFGSPNLSGSAASHGAPLGDAEIALAREELNWPHEPFVIPEEVKSAWDATALGASLEAEWNALFAAYEQQYPELAVEFLRRQYGDMSDQFKEATTALFHGLQDNPKAIATRKASLQCLEALESAVPELFGGSADLSGSNCTLTKQASFYSPTACSGNYINYGVREFAMAAIMNGIALHGGFIPFAGTFLVFSDYARNAIRLSAMMSARVIYVLTHDSIGLGEDGPTHQPVEHIASLRLIPGLHVWRPADALETAVAWQMACQHQGPSCLLLSRQTLPVIKGSFDVAEINRGAYAAFDAPGECQCLLLATGSEVGLAIQAAEQLQQEGIACRVVSVPCMELLQQQEQAFCDALLPPSVTARIAIEAGVAASWYPWVGAQGEVIALEGFGLSAPAEQVYEALGLTVERIVERAHSAVAHQPVRVE